MGASLRTQPRLMRLDVNRDGSTSECLEGKYTLAREAQWLVERQHDELQLLRKEIRTLKAKLLKAKRNDVQPKRQRKLPGAD